VLENWKVAISRQFAQWWQTTSSPKGRDSRSDGVWLGEKFNGFLQDSLEKQLKDKFTRKYGGNTG
jgi:hypothetical protein